MQTAPSTSISEFHQYEALFSYASMGIVMLTEKGIIESVNPFALNLFGYSTIELAGQAIEIFIPQRYHHKHSGYREKYSHNPTSRPMGVGLDLFAIKKDGTEFPVEVSLANYRDNDRKGTIAFISDITIRKKAEAEISAFKADLEKTVEQRTQELTNTLHQLEQSKEDLALLLAKEKELGELKSRFVSMASHEFRTPLSTILSSAYLIEKYDTTEDQPKREKHLQRIISAVSMLTDTLDDFLSVGKIEEGKIQLRLTEFNLLELVANTTAEMQNNLKQSQQITYQHEGKDTVTMDASLLKHILMNLISNAGKFSPEDGHIEVSTVNSENLVLLSVKDNGIGIPKEDQQRLMERFFRAANAVNIQGTGLGLHIVSKYAALMGGTIKCQSELGKGTCFTITFNSSNSCCEKAFTD